MSCSQRMLPQFIINSHIYINRNSRSFFQYDKQEIENQIADMKKAISKLEHEIEEVFFWFTVDQNITKKEAIIIENYLERFIEKHINDKDVNVLLVSANRKATVETILPQIESFMHFIFRKYPFDLFGQVVMGENSILSQSLLIEGARQFGERYYSLYWLNDELTMINYEVSQEPKDWLNLFSKFVHDYDYFTALELIADIGKERSMGLNYLLRSLVKRMNFAFEEAYEYHKMAQNYLPSYDVLDETELIYNKIMGDNTRVKDLELIVELFRQIDAYINIDDVPSFLVRFYRAREAVLFYLLKYARTEINAPWKIEHKSSIYKIFETLEDLYDKREIDGYYGAYFFLKSTNTYNLLNFRNKSFIGHSRKSIKKEQLWSAFAGTKLISNARAKRRFLMDTDLLLRDIGVQGDENFTSINTLLIKLAEEMQERREIYK